MLTRGTWLQLDCERGRGVGEHRGLRRLVDLVDYRVYRTALRQLGRLLQALEIVDECEGATASAITAAPFDVAANGSSERDRPA